ncbi:MAG: DNA polymerase III subunit delta [Lewinellaceae bacterium]|nr:DNA polymerase III subunit delta [Saprospiraceae bacterium]MCB9339274.1 DNA polymerase III subunit delta [Lewinellaceae bacterium]
MTFQQILSELKNKQFRPLYFLHGSEPYFIDAISDYIEANALGESEKAFNQIVLYGRDVDHLAIIDNARRYPMMSPYQVVMVKEAQDMKDLKDLEKYVQNPMPTTILVICHKHKPFNVNTKFGKLLQEKGIVFDSKKLYDNQVPDWIHDYLKHLSLRITPGAADLLGEYLGTDLSLVAHELDKLALHLQKGTEITADHVETYVGISREYNIFELQKAISHREMAKVGRILQNFVANPKRNPLIMVVSSLASFFSKVYMLHFLKNAPDSEAQKQLNLRSSYALRDYRTAVRNFPLGKTEGIISILKDYDLKSKGVDYNTVGKEEGDLLKELIWKIVH